MELPYEIVSAQIHQTEDGLTIIDTWVKLQHPIDWIEWKVNANEH